MRIAIKKQPIFILTGAPASGKTTVSQALLQHFSYGVHISVDNLRGMVVAGLSNPIGSWDEETDQQFRLARDSAALMARTYAQGGFAVAIDDVIFPDQVSQHYEAVLDRYNVHKILLRPTITATKARNKEREIEVDNAQLEQIIKPIYDHFASFDLEEMKMKGWCILDTSRYSVAETAVKILTQVGCNPTYWTQL